MEADDGKNMQTKVGAINGITSSTTANSTDIAASANLVNTRCNELSNNLETTNNKLGGCSFEQNGNAFYVVGADSVRKKLGDQEFAALDCGGVEWTAGEFGQWHHGYHFTKVSEIPTFGSRLHLGLRLKIFCFQILQMLARLFAPVSYLVDGKVGTLLM